jgi:hypothetical protein
VDLPVILVILDLQVTLDELDILVIPGRLAKQDTLVKQDTLDILV